MSSILSSTTAFAHNLMQDKVILATGASGSLGKVISEKFSSLSAKIAIHYHANKEKAIKILNSVIDGGENGAIFMADLEKAERLYKIN